MFLLKSSLKKRVQSNGNHLLIIIDPTYIHKLNLSILYKYSHKSINS